MHMHALHAASKIIISHALALPTPYVHSLTQPSSIKAEFPPDLETLLPTAALGFLLSPKHIVKKEAACSAAGKHRPNLDPSLNGKKAGRSGLAKEICI